VRAHRPTWQRVLVVGVLVVAGLSACGGEDDAVSTITEASGTTPSTTASTTRGPSAADDLVAFFDAVETADRNLKVAADAVNGSIGIDTITVEQSTIDAVDRAEPAAVAAAIPAGLQPAVERAVLLVYSDLVSRFAALRQSSCLVGGTRPRSELDPLCFSQGHAAAKRMPGDVDAARATAGASPRVVVPAPDTRAAAEVRIRVALIDGTNRGCDSGGGFIATEPISIRWYANPSVNPDTPEIPPLDGEVSGAGGGVGFWATYAPRTGWTVQLNAC